MENVFGYIWKLTVLLVHLNGFYTHLNAINIKKFHQVVAFPEMSNSSRDFLIETFFVSF